MSLKMWHLALMSFLIMLFSGVVYGDEIRMPPDSPGVYGEGRSNLLIGGIGQNGPNPGANPEYTMIADQIGAMYIPTYYSGDPGKDSAQVNYAASWSKTYIYPNGLTYQATYQNGLKNNALTGKTYNTIFAYSGGTTTAVTALDKQVVKCHTLILISPMRGTPYENPLIPIDIQTTLTQANQDKLYKEQVKGLLDSGAVQRIVVIQSSDDIPDWGSLYQAKFKMDEDPRIEVNDVDLETTGNQAHIDIFFSYAKKLLIIGEDGEVAYGRTLNWITIKRNDINLAIECEAGKCGKQDKYGHYWIEILDGPYGNPIESYGWWPKSKVGPMETLIGVPGELNGMTNFGGTTNSDPHQGDTADEEFHPRLMNTLTDQQVLDKIHDFVRSYNGEWRWTFGLGQNCRTFQTALMNYVGLAR
jgi:hypothetical protein